MIKLWAIINALHEGEALKDPHIWKNRQAVVNILVTIAGAVLMFLPEGLEVSEADIHTIAVGVATLGGLVNSYLTIATSDKVGFKR